MEGNVLPGRRANDIAKSLLSYSAFALILFGIKLWLIGTYGNATPFWDQWDAEAANLYKPFLEGTLTWHNLFSAHNEHRIFTTRVLSLGLLVINGIWNPLLQMVVNAILHILAMALLIQLIMRVIGRKYLPVLLAFALVLFAFPYAWENTLAGFQSQFYFVLLFSIASLWLIITSPPLGTLWWSGLVCAVLAFFSLASGILVLASSALIGLIFYLFKLRNTRKQLLAIIILLSAFLLGVVLTPSLEYHAYLKAASIKQFIDAVIAILGWPISSTFLSMLIRNLPSLVFVVIMLWKPTSVENRKWFLFGLIVWVFGQAFSIAYGRAAGALGSRYLDLFVLGILVNFASLVSIYHDYADKWRWGTILGGGLWVIIIIGSLGLDVSRHAPGNLSAKYEQGLAQETHMRNYLRTGDMIHLQDKPDFHIPYPVPEHLASILESSVIRTILPSNISQPLEIVSIEMAPEDSFVANGYSKNMPKRTDILFGSHGAQAGNATGNLTMRFDAINRTALLVIPVAGYPLNNGIKVEVEQAGQRKSVAIRNNPEESWGTGYARVNEGPFSLLITDANSADSGWIAVGAPGIAGRLDVLINRLLISHTMFIILGLTIVIILIFWSQMPRIKDYVH